VLEYPEGATEAVVAAAPAEYQSFVEAAGAEAGGAQLECEFSVADVEFFVSGDPQSSQVSLSAVSVVPAAGVDGATDDAYGLAALTPLFMLSLSVVPADEL